MENQIRTLRKQRKLSQDDLARLAHVSRQTINAIENDKYDPELFLAFKIAGFLDTTVDELFVYKPESLSRKRDADIFWCEKYKCVLWQVKEESVKA